jgi:septal ring factor EnvC (AmiA/AmiB activator)
MEMTIDVGTMFSNLPTTVSVLFSLIALAVTGFLHFRKVNIEDKTSSSSVHERQVKSLIEQIEQLSSDLTEARKQLQEIHNQNIELMKQLRNANHRIAELEIVIQEAKRENPSIFQSLDGKEF